MCESIYMPSGRNLQMWAAKAWINCNVAIVKSNNGKPGQITLSQQQIIKAVRRELIHALIVSEICIEWPNEVHKLYIDCVQHFGTFFNGFLSQLGD